MYELCAETLGCCQTQRVDPPPPLFDTRSLLPALLKAGNHWGQLVVTFLNVKDSLSFLGTLKQNINHA